MVVLLIISTLVYDSVQLSATKDQADPLLLPRWGNLHCSAGRLVTPGEVPMLMHVSESTGI